MADIKHPTLDQNYVHQHCHCFWHPSMFFLLNLFRILQRLRPRNFSLPRPECLGMTIGFSMFMSVTKTRKEQTLVNILPNNSCVICSFSVVFGCHCLCMTHIKKGMIFVLHNSYFSVTLIMYKHTFGVENNFAVADIAWHLRLGYHVTHKT